MLANAMLASLLTQRYAVHLDRERQAIICVDPGRNQVSRITLRFDVFDQDVVFAVSRSACSDKGLLRFFQAEIGD